MPRHNSPAWRDAMRAGRQFATEDMVALRDAGLSQSAAARRLGVTQNAIAARLRAEGLDWPPAHRVIDEAVFARLWACHTISREEIGRYLGITASAVGQRAKARGLPSREKVRRKLYREPELRAMWAAGVSSREIAAHFGFAHPSGVTLAARMLGLPPRVRGGRGGRTGVIGMAEYREGQLGAAMAATVRRAGS